jgi:SNW domain-containing protein 1
VPPQLRKSADDTATKTPTALVNVDQSSSKNDNSGSVNVGSAKKKANRAPSYEERCRAATALSKMTPEERKRAPKLFVPRSLADFDDGGAFPEIHVAQYPRHMGNPHLKKPGAGNVNSTSRAIVNVEVDKDGEISYDAIIKGGTNADKKVYSRHDDLKGGEAKEEDVALPNEEEERAAAERTQLALQNLISKKTALDKPSGSAMVNAESSKNVEEKTQFIKYTPRPDAPGYNPAAAQRVIQMVPAQVDPMMPPKHKHLKAPRGPAEDPVPVLHAPPKKLTKEERDKWNVPACISNWKNTRGYTIPLDKRLAADGRGLREHTINSNFATLSESLYVAEKQARQEVRMRAQVQKKLAMQEKDKREEELRELANQARLERSGAAPTAGGNDANVRVEDASDSDLDDSSSREEETEDQVAARQREKLRMERKRERERELRQENNMEIKKQKLESERDVSEKIALGVHTGSGGAGEVDSRLYNQSSGMDSGFGADDEYNTYSKPLFDRQGVSSSSIYRPTRGETEYNADESYDKLVQGATSKFQPAKGFAGAEGGKDIQAGPRSAPVQFEKSKN